MIKFTLFFCARAAPPIMESAVIVRDLACSERYAMLPGSGVTKPGPTRAWARASILKCF